MEFEHVTQGLWRGDRPRTSMDMFRIEAQGIHTVISLEEGWADLFKPSAEKCWWEGMGHMWEQVPCSNWWPPVMKTQKVMNLIQNALPQGNVLIHCYSGVDRTGWMAAMWAYVKGVYSNPTDAWNQEAVGKGQHWWFRWWKPFFILTARRLKGKI